MPEIRVSQITYQRLHDRSISFDDTPEDVIKRLLDQADGGIPSKRGGPPSKPPAPPGTILAVKAYWVPILEVLDAMGGTAPANDVIHALEDRLADKLTEKDRETLNNGEVRWRNRVRFARLRMKERGLLSDTSARGVWEISEPGRQYLAARHGARD